MNGRKPGYHGFCDSCTWESFSRTEGGAVATADDHMHERPGHKVFQDEEHQTY